MFTRLWPLLKLFAAAAITLALIDALVFRSGAYAPWIEPDSTAGSVVGARMAIDRYYEPARKNILVLGNSQIGEGFSAQLADLAAARPALHFINGSIAGTTPRVWNYFLRQIDPAANRFAAIVMMVTYDSTYQHYEFLNYPLDTPYATTLLRLSDLNDYPATFTVPDQRERARRAILLPLQALHEDILMFLAHPLQRIEQVRHGRQGWLYAISQYGGQGGALPELPLDSASGMPSSWGDHEAESKSKLENYFRTLRDIAPPEQQQINDNYLRLWLGRIADRYAASHVPVIVFSMTRGPWQKTLMPAPTASGAVAELRNAGRLLVLPGEAFTALEQPQFFFDTLHLNHAGRERFSALFAQQVAPLVH
jgi:hypothetical protein